MIYEWLFPLHTYDALSFLNVLRYVPFRALAATMTSMILMFGLAPWFIRRLQRQQIGQVIRAEGPESHQVKAGTPTMGGALMLVVLVVSTVLWTEPNNAMVWSVLIVTVSYGLIGYIDDSLKIRKRSSAGLSARLKLLAQGLVALLLCLYLFYGPVKDIAVSESNWFSAGLPSDWLNIRHQLALPFVAFSRLSLELPSWLYVIFATLVIVGTSNAVNLTDGLDGLAIGPVMINAGTYLILAYLSGLVVFGYDIAQYLDIPSIQSSSELTVFCASVIGVGFGFLWYNTYPAQVFMGDVGSLALGGSLGTLAVLTKNELLSLLLGGIFVIEAVSVIFQVVSFKTTGKRVFLMAPIHHHFEKKGWAEPKIIVRFWVVAIMLALTSLSSLKLR